MIGFTVGSSMIPTHGKINLIRITKQKSYKIGDIISLKCKDHKFYCHRIQKINNFLVSTKGDNLAQQNYEKNVSVMNIEGIVKLLWKIRR